jgi:branched-subunit amino acid aminotransferase/4-amino-4-deoxychorismate lyase
MVQKLSKIWTDGKLIPWEEANVHILTHSLRYGLPGPLTRELQAAFFDIVKGKNSEYREWLDYL